MTQPLVPMLILMCAAAAPAATEDPNAAGDASIRGGPADRPITLTTTRRLAGAIHSLTWNGKQFIDSTDHGRQLQSAMNADLTGAYHDETFNPTEAGSRHDGAGPTSTSRLVRMHAAGNQLESTIRMAFWLRPGEQSAGRPAVNTTALSDHLLTKRVTIGYKHLPQVIQYDVTFTVPDGETHRFLQFESLTGYMPAEFDRFWRLDVRSGEVQRIDAGPGEQPYPVIVSTADERHAMGVFSPDQPLPETPGRDRSGYGRWFFQRERVSKWNCVFRVHDPRRCRTGDYTYRHFVAVGTLEDVRQALTAVAAEFRPD